MGKKKHHNRKGGAHRGGGDGEGNGKPSVSNEGAPQPAHHQPDDSKPDPSTAPNPQPNQPAHQGGNSQQQQQQQQQHLNRNPNQKNGKQGGKQRGGRGGGGGGGNGKSVHSDPYANIDKVLGAQGGDVMASASGSVGQDGHGGQQGGAQRRKKRNRHKRKGAAQEVTQGMTKKQLEDVRQKQGDARPQPNQKKPQLVHQHQSGGQQKQPHYQKVGEGHESGDHDDGTDEDFSDTANERAKEYRPGGYHPVYVGELYNDRYRVVHKLGWGYFSTVWLVWDYEKESFQAMKVQKSAKHYREAAYDEIKLLSEIMAGNPDTRAGCARMVDSFEHRGPHGQHVVMVFDVLGENLLKLMERYEYKGIPIPIVKSIARQTLIGLHHIHAIDIIHTDLKPENVLLAQPKHKITHVMKHYKPPPRSCTVKLTDREVSTMTASQRRRFYKQAKKQRAIKDGASSDDEGEQPVDETAKKTVEKVDGMEASTKESSEEVPAEVAKSTSGEAAEETSEKDHKSSSKSSSKCSSDESEDSDDKRGDALSKNKVVVSSSGMPPEVPEACAGGIEEVTAGRVAAEAVLDAEASDTDAEWEVERFHNVCVADFGNSCWTFKKFTDEVQTRQYRSPEVIIGDGYDTSIDLWSAACMFFELLTGEFLFDPKQSSDYPRDEDHLALMIELLGPLPDYMALGNGKFRSQYIDSRGELRHIKELKFWGLADVLQEKYHFTRKKAREIAEFLVPMLTMDPRERATAETMLRNFDHFFQVQEDDYAPKCFVNPKEPESSETPSDEGEPIRNAHLDDEDAVVNEWLASHPLLSPEALEATGLTLDHIKAVLSGELLPEPEQTNALNLIVRLQHMEQRGIYEAAADHRADYEGDAESESPVASKHQLDVSDLPAADSTNAQDATLHESLGDADGQPVTEGVSADAPATAAEPTAVAETPSSHSHEGVEDFKSAASGDDAGNIPGEDAASQPVAADP